MKIKINGVVYNYKVDYLIDDFIMNNDAEVLSKDEIVNLMIECYKKVLYDSYL